MAGAYFHSLEFIHVPLSVFLSVCQRDARERFVFVCAPRVLEPLCGEWGHVPWLKTVHLGRQWGESELAHRRVRLINVQTSVSGQEIMAAVLSFRPARWLLQSKQHSRWIKPAARPTAKKYHPCVRARPQKFNIEFFALFVSFPTKLTSHPLKQIDVAVASRYQGFDNLPS